MTQAPTTPRPPLVLIANGQEWLVRSLESVLGPAGYAVVRAYDGQQAVERARSAGPDVLILDANLPALDGFEVTRLLRADPGIGSRTPVLLTETGGWSRLKQLEARRAGAWDMLSLPLDAEDLLLRLSVFVEAKFEAESARDAGLLDQATGLYNVRGLLRRVAEVSAEAVRHERAVACIVLAPDLGPSSGETGVVETAGTAGEANSEEVVAVLTELIKGSVRVCDALGRIGEAEFVVIAPSTGRMGAASIIRRLTNRAATYRTTTSGTAVPLRFRAGCYAVENLARESVDPVDILVRATTALRMSQAEHGPAADWHRFFEHPSGNWTET